MGNRPDRQNEHVQRSVLLWAAVTLVLWAALPVTMYLSHWQWFAWMPRIASAPPPHGVPHVDGRTGPNPAWAGMAILLMMSTVLLAVVLWLLSIRGERSTRS